MNERNTVPGRVALLLALPVMLAACAQENGGATAGDRAQSDRIAIVVHKDPG
ncbi:MAG: hypothetical protein ACREME_05690 [Gemmatimonadales bacterium]